ncbi:transposase family protein [Hymenobacter polaris]|uniref:transposase family protein n=1 Tax=Hymenobacter polaris TaxID=2682546 RepID=UPI0037446F65
MLLKADFDYYPRPRLKLAWLRQDLPYAQGIPSHNTVNRVMSLLDLRQVERCSVQWSTRTVRLPGGTHLSVPAPFSYGLAGADGARPGRAHARDAAARLVR